MGDQWKQAFSEGQRIKARVLYVDTQSKRVCLSVLPHLVKMAAPQLPSVGTLVEVRRFPDRRTEIRTKCWTASFTNACGAGGGGPARGSSGRRAAGAVRWRRRLRAHFGRL